MGKQKHHGTLPKVIYVAEPAEADAEGPFFAGAPEQLVAPGQRVTLARYTFCDHVDAKGVVKLGRD